MYILQFSRFLYCSDCFLRIVLIFVLTFTYVLAPEEAVRSAKRCALISINLTVEKYESWCPVQYQPVEKLDEMFLTFNVLQVYLE